MKRISSDAREQTPTTISKRQEVVELLDLQMELLSAQIFSRQMTDAHYGLLLKVLHMMTPLIESCQEFPQHRTLIEEFEKN